MLVYGEFCIWKRTVRISAMLQSSYDFGVLITPLLTEQQLRNVGENAPNEKEPNQKEPAKTHPTKKSRAKWHQHTK